jgi:hypothetical protein
MSGLIKNKSKNNQEQSLQTVETVEFLCPE